MTDLGMALQLQKIDLGEDKAPIGHTAFVDDFPVMTAGKPR